MVVGQIAFQRVQLHRNLGVIFDSNLNFDQHRDTIIASAQAALWFVKRALENKYHNLNKYNYVQWIYFQIEYYFEQSLSTKISVFINIKKHN